MNTLHTRTPAYLELLSERLFGLERIGRYEEALLEFSDDWADPAYIPDFSGLPKVQAARLLLRFASILGYEGHLKKIKNSQVRSRDLLTSVREFFLKIGDVELTAESECHIALTYWRTGELNEADSWTEEALSRSLPGSNRSRLFCYVTRTLINLMHEHYEQNIAICSDLETTFLEFGDDLLIGNFFANIGISHKNLDRPDEAARYLELSRHFYQKSGHLVYLATSENNLASLYKNSRKYAKAHSAIDRASRLFAETGDLTREGFSLDTKALIYLEEGKYDDALMTIEKAMSLLKNSENSGYLTEAMVTEAKILLFLDNFRGATSVLIDAVQIARSNGSEASADRLIAQFEEAVEARNSGEPISKRSGNDLETGNLELVLPASISNYEDYQGIWIRNTHLECVGLEKGSLAIVVNETVKPGDLVAISEIESGFINCGFYDSDFGIVCLEGCGTEPQLFDESDVRIIGKVVGVCRNGRGADGKMIVEALNPRPFPENQ